MRPTLPQKFYLAYHLVIGGGQLWTPLLATPTAPEALHGSGQVREAWTDVGKNAVVRRADLGRSDKFSQVSVHLEGWTPSRAHSDKTPSKPRYRFTPTLSDPRTATRIVACARSFRTRQIWSARVAPTRSAAIGTEVQRFLEARRKRLAQNHHR